MKVKFTGGREVKGILKGPAVDHSIGAERVLSLAHVESGHFCSAGCVFFLLGTPSSVFLFRFFFFFFRETNRKAPNLKFGETIEKISLETNRDTFWGVQT